MRAIGSWNKSLAILRNWTLLHGTSVVASTFSGRFGIWIMGFNERFESDLLSIIRGVIVFHCNYSCIQNPIWCWWWGHICKFMDMHVAGCSNTIWKPFSTLGPPLSVVILAHVPNEHLTFLVCWYFNNFSKLHFFNVTPSFQLRIAYRLKHWILDFLIFEMVYRM